MLYQCDEGNWREGCELKNLQPLLQLLSPQMIPSLSSWKWLQQSQMNSWQPPKCFKAINSGPLNNEMTPAVTSAVPADKTLPPLMPEPLHEPHSLPAEMASKKEIFFQSNLFQPPDFRTLPRTLLVLTRIYFVLPLVLKWKVIFHQPFMFLRLQFPTA